MYFQFIWFWWNQWSHRISRSLTRIQKKTLLCLAAALLLGAGAVAWYFLVYFPTSSFSAKSEQCVFDLAPGSSVKAMTQALKREGVFTAFQAQLFCWWIQWKGAQYFVRAGEYAIPLNTTPEKLLAQLVKGEVIQYALTFKEGATLYELQALLASHPKLKKNLKDLLAKESHVLLARKEASLTLEGLFFPDTYYFVANTSDILVLQRAYQTMQDKLQRAWEERDKEIILKTPYEALILASIIEKETGEDRERAMISGVFQRRLAKNMRLQADPTVLYGLENKVAELTKSHLKQDTPYNTYLHKGLPPTPIALPSLKSIIAAMHPDKGETLYFVANGDGSHQFSVTLAEHNTAVQQYREKKALSNE